MVGLVRGMGQSRAAAHRFFWSLYGQNRHRLCVSPATFVRPALDFRYPAWQHLQMGKIRRGNYLFVTWVGDHPPRHVHVYKEGKLIVKWDLENRVAMKGQANNRILKLIAELEEEGRL